MLKPISKIMPAIALIVILITFSNFSPPAKSLKEFQTLQSFQSVIKIDTPKENLYKNVMHVLYIERDSLKKWDKKRTVFKYYINADNQLTLYGWQLMNNVSKDNYDDRFGNTTELKYGNPMPKCDYGQGYFLGGVMIKRSGVRVILRHLRHADSTIQYVLFVPKKDSSIINGMSKPNGHFIYDIKLSDVPHYDPANKTIIQTTVSANPSPPRNVSGKQRY